MKKKKNVSTKTNRVIDGFPYTNRNRAFKIFSYILDIANKKKGYWERLDRTVERGQRIISYKKIAEKFGFKIDDVRRVIKDLEGRGYINVKSISNFIVITVVDFDKYDDCLPKIDDKKLNLSQGENERIDNIIENLYDYMKEKMEVTELDISEEFQNNFNDLVDELKSDDCSVFIAVFDNRIDKQKTTLFGKNIYAQKQFLQG